MKQQKQKHQFAFPDNMTELVNRLNCLLLQWEKLCIGWDEERGHESDMSREREEELISSLLLEILQPGLTPHPNEQLENFQLWSMQADFDRSLGLVMMLCLPDRWRWNIDWDGVNGSVIWYPPTFESFQTPVFLYV